MLGIIGRGWRELRSVMALSWVTVLLLLELSPKHGTRSVNKRWLFCCYRSAIDLTFCDLVCLWKVFALNLATSEERIIQFRIVDRDLTPRIGLNESETFKHIELLRENIAVVAPANPSVPVTASEVTTPLTLEAILTNYPQVFDDSCQWSDNTTHLGGHSD